MTITEFEESDDSLDVEEPSSPPDAATVTIKGAGISITRPVDEATMSSIIALLFGGAAAAPASGPSFRQQPQTQHQPVVGAGAPLWDPDLTLGEFLGETEARTFQQKICAVGYYLTKFDGTDSFDRDGIKAELVAAHEDMPGNFGRDFASTASSRLIAAKPGEAGQYRVTRTGRKAVESFFQDVPKRKAPRRRKAAQSPGNGDAE